MIELSEWLKEARARHELSSEALALRIGVRHEQLEAWEAGNGSPSAAELRRLEEILGAAEGVNIPEDSRPAWWKKALELKDKMDVRELAEHLGVSPGVLTTELRRARVFRRPPVDHARPGSKDERLHAVFHLLGKVPDNDIAREARVSVRTVAAFRARNKIAGYAGPRRRPKPRGSKESRLEDFRHVVGVLPDRVVAEVAGMSLGAVRNFRIKNGIEPAGRMPKRRINAILKDLDNRVPADGVSAPAAAPAVEPEPTGPKRAWRARVRVGDETRDVIVVAGDLVHAARRAVAAAGGEDRNVVSLETLGDVVDTAFA
jgi:hypothetical protein